MDYFDDVFISFLDMFLDVKCHVPKMNGGLRGLEQHDGESLHNFHFWVNYKD